MNHRGQIMRYLLVIIVAVVVLFLLFTFLFKADIINIFKNLILGG